MGQLPRHPPDFLFAFRTNSNVSPRPVKPWTILLWSLLPSSGCPIPAHGLLSPFSFNGVPTSSSFLPRGPVLQEAFLDPGPQLGLPFVPPS